MISLLWIAAVIIGIYGVMRLLSGDIAVGLLLILIACAIGPGGNSLYR